MKRLPQEKTVLLMDDEVSILGVISSVLSLEGYRVTCARNGEEALGDYRSELMKGTPFNAVILDLVVPGGMGGKETMIRLREMDPGVKAIVSSGYSEDPVMASFREYGFVGVLPKPYRMQKLLDVLERVISCGEKHLDGRERDYYSSKEEKPKKIASG